MPPRPLALAVLLGLASCGGCRGREEPQESRPVPPAVDASPAPWRGVVVARAIDLLDVDRLAGDGLVVRAGILLYAASASGALTRIGAPSDYVPFLPEGDEELAGYDARTAFLGNAIVSGTAERPFVRVRPEHVLGWDGHTWKKELHAPPPEDVWRHRWHFDERADAGPSKEGLPPGYDWTHHVRASGGRVVWLGSKEMDDGTAVDVVAAAPAAGKEARIVRYPSGDELPAGRQRRCDFLHSADEHVYVRCSISRWGDGVLRDGDIYRLGADRLEAIAAFHPDVGVEATPMILAIDAEGAAWSWRSTGGRVTIGRLGVDGAEESFDLPAASDDLTAPAYDTDEIQTKTTTAQVAGARYRSWTSATVTAPEPPASPVTVIRIVARRAGDVWIVAREPGGASALYRFARGGAPPQPVLLRSMADEQNEIRNARGLRRWVGHCATVFVPFPGATASDGGADAFFASRKAAIDAVVSKMDHPTKGRPDVAVVEGMLGDRRAAGVLFIRSHPEASEPAMEAAAATVAELVTTNPASPPDATCSAPVLERVLHRYEPRHGTAVYEGE